MKLGGWNGDLGLPVPRQQLVRTAERLNFPVVIKPLDANHGRGVSINLETNDAVRAAFEKAQEHSNSQLRHR